MIDIMVKYDDYWVCSNGEVFSNKIGYVISRKNNKIEVLRKLKHDENKDGYLRLWLSNNGKQTRIFTHQLVLVAFKDILKGKNKELIDEYIATSFKNEPKKPHQLVIDHIDGDRQNNSLQNLQIITQEENLEKRNYEKRPTTTN